MSESSEKILGIKKLPLFPLPLVHMPFEFLPLYIFEPRYQELLSDVQLEKNIFGISLFQPKESYDEKPEIGSVGCATEIVESQTLEDGRSNILATGVIRYRLLDLVETEKQYFVGEIDFFEDEKEDETVLEKHAEEVFQLFERIAKAAHSISTGGGQFPDIPRVEPEKLSFLVAAAFNLEIDLKYEFIEMRSTSKRLKKLKGILRKSVSEMEESAMINKISRTNGHSKKKIDLN